MMAANAMHPEPDLMLRPPAGNAFIHISLQALDFHIGKARVLKCLFADAKQGQLVALMGESGSGKSTLLNVLGGRSSYGVVSLASPHTKDELHPVDSWSEGSGSSFQVSPMPHPLTQPMLLNGAAFEPRNLKALIGFVPYPTA